MGLFRGYRISQKQLDELKKEINKSEYEKITEPFKKRNHDLIDDVNFYKHQLKNFMQVINEIVDNMAEDYIEIVVDIDNQECSLCTDGNPPLKELKFRTVKIETKPGLKKAIYKRLDEIEQEFYDRR